MNEYRPKHLHHYDPNLELRYIYFPVATAWVHLRSSSLSSRTKTIKTTTTTKAITTTTSTLSWIITTRRYLHSPSSSSSSSSSSATVWSDFNALCIIPPDQVWDTIQRARYLAHDTTYAIWPPAIRLFHPFPYMEATVSSSSSTSSFDLKDGKKQNDNIAFDIANIIETYNVSTFPITLSEWSIIPHMEEMNIHPYGMESNPTNRDDNNDEYDDTNKRMTSTIWQQPQSRYVITNPDDQKVQELIRSVEEKGKQRLLIRQEKSLLKKQQQQQQQQAQSNVTLNDNDPTAISATVSSASMESKSNIVDATTAREMYSEYVPKRARKKKNKNQVYSNNDDNDDDVYNGPCVICLEPDIKSKQRIQQLRQLLVRQLFPNNMTTTTDGGGSTAGTTTTLLSSLLYTSPTGSVLSSSSTKSSSTFFNRNSRMSEMSSVALDYRPVVPIAAFPNVNSAIKVAKQFRSLWKPLTFNVTDLHIISSSLPLKDDETTTTTGRSTSTAVTNHQVLQYQAQYGCDALITLMGVPLPADDNYCDESDGICDNDIIDNDRINTTEIIELLCAIGEPGGYYNQNSHPSNVPMNMTTFTGTPYSNNSQSSHTDTTNDKTRRLGDNDSDVMSSSNMINTTTTTTTTTNITSEFEQWLYGEDDEYHEGTVVIIGRTQFFTGEMRQYVGMPATSAFVSSRTGNTADE